MSANPIHLDPNRTEFYSVEMPDRLLNFAFVRVADPTMVGITDGTFQIEVPRKTMPMLAIGASQIFDTLVDEAEDLDIPLSTDPDSERSVVQDAWG